MNGATAQPRDPNGERNSKEKKQNKTKKGSPKKSAIRAQRKKNKKNASASIKKKYNETEPEKKCDRGEKKNKIKEEAPE